MATQTGADVIHQIVYEETDESVVDIITLVAPGGRNCETEQTRYLLIPETWDSMGDRFWAVQRGGGVGQPEHLPQDPWVVVRG